LYRNKTACNWHLRGKLTGKCLFGAAYCFFRMVFEERATCARQKILHVAYALRNLVAITAENVKTPR
jgi:hypothetical protein